MRFVFLLLILSPVIKMITTLASEQDPAKIYMNTLETNSGGFCTEVESFIVNNTPFLSTESVDAEHNPNFNPTLPSRYKKTVFQCRTLDRKNLLATVTTSSALDANGKRVSQFSIHSASISTALTHVENQQSSTN